MKIIIPLSAPEAHSMKTRKIVQEELVWPEFRELIWVIDATTELESYLIRPLTTKYLSPYGSGKVLTAGISLALSQHCERHHLYAYGSLTRRSIFAENSPFARY